MRSKEVSNEGFTDTLRYGFKLLYTPSHAESVDAVPSYRRYIAPIGAEAPTLTTDDESFLVDVVMNVNRNLSRAGIQLGVGVSCDYFTQLIPQIETNDAIERAVVTANTVAKPHDDVLVICPPAGATPLALMLNHLGFPENRIIQLEISGSSGVKSGNAHIKDNVALKAIENPSLPVLLLEDVGDSYDTTLQLVQARNKARMGDKFDQTGWNDLEIQLRAAHDNGNNGEEIYKLFVRACAEENVLLLPVFSKNDQVLRALNDLVDHENPDITRWQELQSNLLDEYPITSIDNRWVIGAGLLDTGIKISVILPYLSEEIQKSDLILRLMKDEDNQWLLRIGTTVPGLGYLADDPKLNHLENIIQLVASEFKKVKQRS